MSLALLKKLSTFAQYSIICRRLAVYFMMICSTNLIDEYMYENYDADDIHSDDDVCGPLAIARCIQDRLIAEKFGR